MKFSSEILKKIIQFGADGYSPARIARELNITPDELRDQRATDEKLNDAMERSEYNFNQYLLGKIEEKSISLDSRSQVEIYRMLRQKYNNNSDNEIIVRRV